MLQLVLEERLCRAPHCRPLRHTRLLHEVCPGEGGPEGMHVSEPELFDSLRHGCRRLHLRSCTSEPCSLRIIYARPGDVLAPGHGMLHIQGWGGGHESECERRLPHSACFSQAKAEFKAGELGRNVLVCEPRCHGWHTHMGAHDGSNVCSSQSWEASAQHSVCEGHELALLAKGCVEVAQGQRGGAEPGEALRVARGRHGQHCRAFPFPRPTSLCLAPTRVWGVHHGVHSLEASHALGLELGAQALVRCLIHGQLRGSVVGVAPGRCEHVGRALGSRRGKEGALGWEEDEAEEVH
mmetsp:Transcript_1314/g.4141  ORF Transcript_1314/g.4141 Transcript_1314/m.4141 type:complete len:295 (+) Transcript_1314:185-1069(+)